MADQETNLESQIMVVKVWRSFKLKPRLTSNNLVKVDWLELLVMRYR